MQLKRIKAFPTFIVIAILLTINSGCRKDIPLGKFDHGAIAFTFDDNFIENWHQYLPLLDSLNIKATFYISHYHRYTEDQKAKLKEIAARGHEIAFHTATHPDLVKEVKKKGMAVVMREEIEKDLHLMKHDGFEVCNFAYPFGSYDASLNTSLLRIFKSVRCVTNKDNFCRGFVAQSGEQQVYFGVPVDMNAALDDNKIAGFIKTAQDRKDCLILFAHQIEKQNVAYQITVERIKLIARQAAAQQIPFVRIKDIQ
jgi:peptidoglycan/xylan/chitin deacetylase (PgdA/CDA1 family)